MQKKSKNLKIRKKSLNQIKMDLQSKVYNSSYPEYKSINSKKTQIKNYRNESDNDRVQNQNSEYRFSQNPSKIRSQKLMFENINLKPINFTNQQIAQKIFKKKAKTFYKDSLGIRERKKF